ncbi:MAG: UvrB/uvrC motif protein [Candidatus Latescibacteria bacterium ADurb.Bin168]|nr:MAG: UvrB/uvrC motif protein [Candidatus Latescibacteria bacterium ADurb.Bin168]
MLEPLVAGTLHASFEEPIGKRLRDDGFIQADESSVSKDISSILEGWDFRPDRPAVRRIVGDDGRPRLQIRLDLGLLQMEVSGRPDGKRPHGFTTALEYYMHLAEEAPGEEHEGGEFRLDEEDCMRLQQESMQFYHRRISWLELGEYRAAEEDADHNLKIIDFVVKYAENDQLREMFTQWKPFILVHKFLAGARQAWEAKDFDGAVERINQGIEDIADIYREQGREDAIENSGEISYLKKWLEDISQTRPLTLEQRVERELREAIASEHFERAAVLRDRLQALRQSARTSE